MNATRNAVTNTVTQRVTNNVPTRPDPKLVLTSAGRGVETPALHESVEADAMPETTHLDDLDWALGCTSHHGCQQRAEWLLTVSCCDRQALLCSEHLLRWVRAERAAIASHAAACRVCGREIESFEGFARWERL